MTVKDEIGSAAHLAVDQLEALIDAYGLASVVGAIAEISCAKAGHIQENWQDNGLAVSWMMAANAIVKLSVKIDSLKI